jgi:hypothetical protein
MNSGDTNETGSVFPIAGDGLGPGIYHLFSKFTSVTNFVNRREQIVYLTSDKELLSANSIFFPDPDLLNSSSLDVSTSLITAGGKKFKRAEMGVYDSGFDFSCLDHERFEKEIVKIPSQFHDRFPEKSLMFLLLPGAEKYFTSEFDRQFVMNARKSSELLGSGNLEEGIRMLKGTGYGLTPSGDDFIAGLLLGSFFHEAKTKSDQSSRREKIYRLALGKNLLTNSFLLNAKDGKYFKPLKKVLLLLCDDDRQGFHNALVRFLGIGATSGADFLAGYIFTIKFQTGI